MNTEKQILSGPYGSLLDSDVEFQTLHPHDSQVRSVLFNSSTVSIISLILSALSGGFGNSLEPVTILTFLNYSFLLVFCHTLYENEKSFSLSAKWKMWVLCWILEALGFCLGFSSTFGDGAVNVILTFCVGLLLWLLILILVVFPYLCLEMLYPRSILGIFGFAITHTSVTCSLVGNVLSTFVIPGNAVLDYEPLRNVAFFFGVYGVNFLMILMALFPPYLYRKWKILGSRYTTNVMTYFTIGFIVCFVVTGFVAQSQYLYQVNGSDLVRPSIQVSCINAQSIEYQTAEWYTMWNQTHLRILKGDAIVMMTEEALLLRSDQQVDNAIALAKSIVTESPVTEGALLGLTYAIFEPGESKGMNRFVLISSDNGGTILWNYVKAHPVPIVENNITAGKATIPTASSPYGKLGGAICFDLDFPQYIAQAGRSKVDLFLQPSWTWNAILTRHFEGDALRAIENGFTLFRCSSVGESGIVDPYGKFLSRQITGTDPTQLSVFLLPLQPHINTVFVYFGFIFEYICIAASAFAYIVVISTFFDYKWNIFES